MPRPFTGKTHTGIRRVVRPNGDVYVYCSVQENPHTKSKLSAPLSIIKTYIEKLDSPG